MTPPRRRGLTERAADAAVDQACRTLRLPTIHAEFPELAENAAREQMSYRGFLAELLMAECDDDERYCSERRIKPAPFPREKSLRTFDFDANPQVEPRRHPHPRHLRLDHERALTLPDRRLRQEPPPHRVGHSSHNARLASQVHPGHPAGERTRRGG